MNLKSCLIMALAAIIALAGFSGIPAAAVAEENVLSDTAYIMYADSAWAYQYWSGEPDSGIIANNAAITGEGTYTVSLDFTATEQGYAEGVAFAALGIVNGESTFPNYKIHITSIKVNGEDVAFVDGYTSSDDGVCTRMNIYNEWVSEIPADARAYNGDLANVSPIMAAKDAFGQVKTLEVTFDYIAKAIDTAYIMYADASWVNQNWGTESSDTVTVKTAEIYGDGEYSVGLEFATPAEGLAFAALGIVNGEITFPGAGIKITDIRVNGQSITPTGMGYTSSDDGVCTRMNIYNEWVSEIPADAHVIEDDVADASPVIVSQDDFASVSSIEVDFIYETVKDTAFIAFASADWTVSIWDGNYVDGILTTPAVIDGPGTYTTDLVFETPVTGVAFTALYVENGEITFPGYYIDICEITINGQSVELTKGYTTSDDGICTRENIFNEWVSELPATARRADGDLEGASSIILDTSVFTDVTEMVVTFNYIYGKPAETADEALTEEEAAEMLGYTYYAFIGFQGTDTYVFRNAWNDSYGLLDEEHNYFYQMTGWEDSKTWAANQGIELVSADDGSVSLGGEFLDAEVTFPGEYTVSVTAGDLGFGATEAFNLLYVSTDIPSALYNGGYITIDNVKVKFGEGKTQSVTHDGLVDASGTYIQIKLIDTYNLSGDSFGYTVPGAGQSITVNFTVSLAE